MRGQCGKESFFRPELPCPDNGLALEPTAEARAKLVGICGEKWSSGRLCCNEAQMDTLESNLKQADAFVASCPACRENFYNLFCTFTCSPDQSTFVNITQTAKSNTGKQAVTELDTLWAKEYKAQLYDSCKEVKFGATGGRAMDLLGGGAKNYTEFLDFLGEKKLIGSPFQINFPKPEGRETDGMHAVNPVARACNDTDERYRCSCVDCPGSCATLPALEEEQACRIGLLPCLSFAAVLVYSVFLALLIAAVAGHVAYRKHARRQNERLRLLQDAHASDNEDDEDDEALLVHNAGMLDKPQRSYRLNSVCDRAFARLGGACARYPLFTISTSVFVVFLLSLGWINFEVERDPVRLWVSPSSAAAQEKAYFDDKFGPFYRAEQAFLVNDSHPDGGISPVLTYDTLQWWFAVEKAIRRESFGGVTLDQVCFNPTGKACVVQSVTGYFGGDFNKIKQSRWQKQVSNCAYRPTDCLPPFDLPLDKKLLFGGYNESQSVLDASTLITTWVLANHAQGSANEALAMQWEQGLLDTLELVQGQAKARGLRLSYSTQISLEQELNQSANTDAGIVVISYVVMFIYASFALGSASLSLRAMLNKPVSAFIHSKFTLGISGIVIVLLSVSASVGLFSAAGIKVTLIIAEVIPFLVLAVGVDNIFLIVHEFERVNQSFPDEEIDSRIAKALGRMGPSILLSASTETIAFVLGVFVGMPAVRNFAAYAAGAVLINALLQVTMFVAVLALDQKRRESNRIDCLPFLKLKQQSTSLAGAYGEEEEGMLQSFLRRRYAPFLLNRQVKVVVVSVFLGIFTAGVALIPGIQLGLDQRLAIPDGSYLIDYFNDVYAYLNTGPPVYFVARNVDVAKRPQQEALCSRFTTCDPYSLANVLELEAKRPEKSYITGSTANWFDDFFFWLNPQIECCTNEHGKPCFADRDPQWNITLHGMPEGMEFVHYVEKWLEAPSDVDCVLGGKAPYSQAVVVDAERNAIEASNFRTSHTPLRSQEDFIASYASARRIAADISTKHDIDVFPYSVHYIFFDQYESITRLAGALLGSAAALILLVTSVLLGSLATGVVVTLTVAMIVVDILGTMVLADVALNALSLVNLVISVGIGVEFCAHVARAFAFPARPLLERARAKYRGHDARAWAALVNVGGSVFSGITVTKLVGVCVLAFTHSKIFEVYYFRVWLALVLWAALHALVFLPVALSLVGGEG